VTTKNSNIGFGFDPDDTEHHFVVDVPSKGAKDIVRIYERFAWNKEELVSLPLPYGDLKATLDPALWTHVAPTVARAFNARLKTDGKPAGRWRAGRTPVERLLGKELVLLVWAVDGNDVGSARRALHNWQALTHEERWWLYTMTNATSRSPEDNKRWWRRAMAYALCEEPVSATSDKALFGNQMDGAEEGHHGKDNK
jgi:hypothetical protein